MPARPADHPDLGQLLHVTRQRAPRSHWLHLAAAVIYLFTLPLATAPNGVAFLVLVIIAFGRLPWTWRCLLPLARMPVIWALVVFVGWYTLALTWSADPAQGWDEVKALRVLLVPWLLRPVIEGVVPLVVATLLGVLASNGVQLLQALGIVDPGYGGRLDGLIHAIQLGSWCAAAACWHLAASLLTRGRWRWLSLLGLATSLLGLVATGSRGPWIAAAVAVPLCLAATAWRHRTTRRTALLLVVLGLLGGLAAWPIAGEMVVSRIGAAVEEIQTPGEPDYTSSTGLRLGLWQWSLDVWREAPVIGTGTGSFLVELREEPDFEQAVATVAGDAREIERMSRDHAHSTYLHTLATTGLVGLLALLIVLALAAWRAARDQSDHPYAAAQLFVLLTWLIGAQFDCYHLNGHQLGLFAVVVAFTLRGRGDGSSVVGRRSSVAGEECWLRGALGDTPSPFGGWIHRAH